MKEIMPDKIASRYKFSGVKSHIKMPDLGEIEKDLIEQSCYVCGAFDYESISEVDRYGFFYPTGMCKQCGNVQQEKYYDEKTLDIYYSKYYRNKGDNVDNDTKSLFDSQINGQGLAIFEFLKSVVNPKKVLEVGCGTGGVLSRYVDLGCEVLGLDFDENYLEYARKKGIPVKNGSLDQLRYNEKYDLIILCHVLEHIPNPSRFLETLSNHLADEGIIYIEVPSLDNVKNGGYKYDLLKYYQNAHAIHFTTKSLNLVCKKAGLKPIKMTKFIHSCWAKSVDTTVISEEEKVDSLRYSKDLLVAIESNRKSLKAKLIEAKLLFRTMVSKILSVLGVREIIRSVYFKMKK